MEGTISQEEVKLKRELKKKRAMEKRLSKLEEKYVTIEKKLNSGFSSEVEEALITKGCNVTVNPMLYRPYALLRYVCNKGMEWVPRINSKILDLMITGIVQCGSQYPPFGRTRGKLDAGLKVVYRHIKYGPSELDDVYCFAEWSKCFKINKNKIKVEPFEGPADIILLENNSEILEYLDNNISIDGYISYEEKNPRSIFNKVAKNLAKCTFDIINSGKVYEPKCPSSLNEILHGIRDGYTPIKGISHFLYAELFKFVQINRFDSFEEFESQGIERFFSEWLAKYNKLESEIVERNIRIKKIKMGRPVEEEEDIQPEYPEEDNKKVTQFDGQDREVLQTTSLFENSETKSVVPLNNKDDELRRISMERKMIPEEMSMERKMITEEMRVKRRSIIKARTEKRLRKLEGKYEKLETKLGSGLTSDTEEVLVRKGYNVNLNPMLFRPYALLRYTVDRAMNSYPDVNSKLLGLLIRGIVKCGVPYPDYGYERAKLNAGLRVVIRHIKYGSSELDEIYCLNEWVRCLKSYGSEPTYNPYEVPADINLLVNNSELHEYLENLSTADRTSSYVEQTPDEIFRKVFRNLVKCTFDTINSGKVAEPKRFFDLNQVLNGLQGGYISSSGFGQDSYAGYPPFSGISQVLYAELFKFIQHNEFNSFEEFDNEGISKFFSEWLSKHDEIAAEIIREYDMRRNVKMEQQNKSRVNGELDVEEENNKITQFASPNRETLRTTSLFESSKEENNSSFSDDGLLTPKDEFLTKEVEDTYLGNSLKRPVRTEKIEEKSLEKQLKLKLKSAEEMNKTIEALQDEIEKIESLLQVKKAALKPLIEQENILWDDIEELQKNLK